MSQLFHHESAKNGHFPLPPMVGVRGMGEEQGCHHGNHVFSCQVISQTETDAVSKIWTHTLLQSRRLLELNRVYRVPQTDQALLLTSILFQSSQKEQINFVCSIRAFMAVCNEFN